MYASGGQRVAARRLAHCAHARLQGVCVCLGVCVSVCECLSVYLYVCISVYLCLCVSLSVYEEVSKLQHVDLLSARLCGYKMCAHVCLCLYVSIGLWGGYD